MRRITKDVKMVVPISPMIDVIFLLIIFFVVTTTIEKDIRNVAVELAESGHLDPEIGEQLKIVVNIWKDNGRIKYAVGDFTCTKAQVEQALLTTGSAYGHLAPLVVRAGRNVEYTHVAAIIDAAGNAGLTRVRFAAQDVQ
jgi:biopolymer transport protein ExbD